MKLRAEDIAYNGVIAALYVALTLITYPISFLGIQFRVSELLILLCFFRRDNILGLTIGCIIANLFSAIGPIDALFGAIATLLSGLAISFMKQLGLAILIPVVVNSFVVGFELNWILKEPFWISVGLVAIGEVVVLIVGYVFCLIFKKKSRFYSIIRANRNLDFKW